MKAFLPCAGVGSRLRPYTHFIPKAGMPFLNLPLLCYNWFYLEKLAVSHFYLNSHLFPQTLAHLVRNLKTSHQKTKQIYEACSLGSAGGLFNFKEDLNDFSFFYINGDSLFFPSSIELLSEFKNHLSDSLGVFFTVPLSLSKNEEGAFWVNHEGILQKIGGFSSSCKNLRPVRFVGLASFSKKILKFLSPKSNHIFHDVMIPHLKKGRFKVFIDEKGKSFEGGSEEGLLKATEVCMPLLFSSTPSSIKNILENVFKRFDPQDQKIGIEKGRDWTKKSKGFLLCPNELGDSLSIKNFAVIGKEVIVKPQSSLEKSVLYGNLTWQGDLKNKIVIQF